ncbi:hypothetical protein [Microbacterium sp.]|uniref:CASTOR/POLLUX-related putative ion channel n=1 Tax=Microbacterium sp. TaxID=51671 RepID=UPI0037CAF35C
MDRPSVRARLQYGFDTWMSRGTIAIMALLGVATVAFVLVVAAVVIVFRAFPEGVEDGDFWDVAWGNLMRTLDPGTMGGDAGWGFRLLMLIVTVGGLIIVASLIGIVSGAFDDKMAQLRKGRSRVLEDDHTLILGWSSKVIPIIAEVCIANASHRRGVIVVLADRDKVEMEEEIRAQVPNPGRTKIICRNGDPMSPLDLQIVSPRSAKSIIILPADGDADPDATAIKVALALTHTLDPGRVRPHLVAELRDPGNLDAAHLVGQDRAQWLIASELISRMTVQTCRQSGLSLVYTELLDFSGDEIYFTRQPNLVGSTYFDAQLCFADSTLLGIATADGVQLNPPPTRVVQDADRLIVLAQDDSATSVGHPAAVDESALSHAESAPPRAERTLILGCNSSLQTILDELGSYVAQGSAVCVAADVPEPALRIPSVLDLTFRRLDTTSRAGLESLDIVDFDHIIVLAYRDLLEAQAADARTLVTLLHLRDIADRHAIDLNIVTEMLDDRNRELAEVTKADDFIVSDRLVSLMLSQISESEDLVEVFQELFSSTGVEIYLRPADLYVALGVDVDFSTVLAGAAARRETAIGYRVGSETRSRSAGYGVRLNPPKGERRAFAPRDRIIVLAAHERSVPDGPQTETASEVLSAS